MRKSPTATGTAVAAVQGTACPGCIVEIFSDLEDEGRWFEGNTAADESGAFHFTSTYPIPGPNLTATATAGVGTTSSFSLPVQGAVLFADGF